MAIRWGAVLLGALVAASGCGVGEGTGSTPPWQQAESPTAPAVPEDESLPEDEPVETIDPYKVKMVTTKGEVIIQVHPEWAPRGAARFRELVEAGYYDDNRIFRVVPGFVIQVGMHGDPGVNAAWDEKTILDDPVRVSNKRGYVTFATSGQNARTTQIFINLADNPNLDTMPGSFAPFGEVIEGMDVVDQFNSEYGEEPTGKQPHIAVEGNAYLDREFPGLDSIVKATVIDEPGNSSATEPEQEPPDSGEEENAADES